MECIPLDVGYKYWGQICPSVKFMPKFQACRKPCIPLETWCQKTGLPSLSSSLELAIWRKCQKLREKICLEHHYTHNPWNQCRCDCLEQFEDCFMLHLGSGQNQYQMIISFFLCSSSTGRMAWNLCPFYIVSVYFSFMLIIISYAIIKHFNYVSLVRFIVFSKQ